MRQDITLECLHKRVRPFAVAATSIRRVLKAGLTLRQVLSDRLVSDMRLRMRRMLTRALHSEPTVFGKCFATTQSLHCDTNRFV